MTVLIQDSSRFRKAGVKGPRAAAWLASQDIDVPPAANTWTPLPGGALICRLAETEFFLEDGSDPGPATKLAPLLDELPAGVYPVPRQDSCFVLTGKDIHEVLLQVCSVDFSSNEARSALFMTSMAGVPVLAIPQELGGVPTVKIWADPTFGPYLWHTLSKIVQELTRGSQ
jgi:sarcosine oxidase subunit gamma